MVKGNWERRAELAANRRDLNRQNKIQKKLKIPSIESIINVLLNNKSNSINDIIICWLNPLDVDILNNNESFICKQWFRFGNCINKKCKLSHFLYDDKSKNINENNDISFSDLINVSSYNNNDNNEDKLKEKTCLLPVLLSSIHIKDSHRIRFIAFNKTLVYDSLCFDFWNEYNNKQKNNKKEKDLFIINEEEEEEYYDINDNDDINIKRDNNNNIINNFDNMKIKNENYLIKCKSFILSEILSYLSYTTIINLISSSKYFKQFCIKDESIRKLKKELFSSLSSTISKIKKENKKKLLKNSNISKKDKKEGFKICAK
jgi:hypothetical protein